MDRRSRPSPQLIVAANRLPVKRLDDGTWETSPGGLVSALAPVLREREGSVWVGWAGDTESAPDPFGHDGLQLHPVELSANELDQYYEGFSNASLWPLYHDAIAQPEYHRSWWEAYVRVNHRFADTILEIAEPGATVWVHDYQLQLVPAMLREAEPDLHIGFFLHTPFPARELFLRLPWRTQVVEGLLGADLVGFQTKVMAHNFRYVAPRVSYALVRGSSLVHGDRTTVAKTFPIGIEHRRFVDAAERPDILADIEGLRDSVGHAQTVLLGVDRLDYTKGIERRLQAYRELLADGRLDPAKTVMIQIAEPSRSNVNMYPEIRAMVEQLVGEINGEFATVDRPAIIYLHRSHNFDELMAMYRLADVMLVTPFRDGMNLVAKEFVATRVDNTGSLVLSEFAGAANELKGAVLVNPYDIEGLKRAIAEAVYMPLAEQHNRMSSMRKVVARNNAHRWATSFLDVLEST
ncbi:MAG: trehalose-6-phosphate synthase [Acidimicrobiia bacterium]|nr:trehalose-6-phosphate synthase [Acidimicrobiia bacterium]